MKKLISIIMSIALLCSALFLFSACGDNNTDDLTKVKEAGQIVVGMECAYAPYNWSQTTANEYTVKIADNLYADGFDVQVAKQIAAALHVELVIKPIEWDGLIPALTSGQIDMIVAGMSPTEDRKLSIDFTDIYLESNLVMVVKKDSAYASATKISDFSGAKITGQLNTFHYDVIDQIAGVQKAVAAADFAAMMQQLESGAIDGYVCERPGAVSAAYSHTNFTFVEFEEGFGFECDLSESSIAIGLRKGSTLTESLNGVIASLSAQERNAMMDAAIARQPEGE